MKRSFLFLTLIFLAHIYFLNAQPAFNQKITLRINEHDYTIPNDFLNEFDKLWKEHKGDFEKNMIGKGKPRDAVVTGGKLNNHISSISFEKGASSEELKIKLSIENNRLKFRARVFKDWWGSWHTKAKGNVNIDINLTLKILTDSLRIGFKVTAANYDVQVKSIDADNSFVDFITLNFILREILLEIGLLKNGGSFDAEIEEYINKKYDLLKLTDINNDTYLGNPSDPVMTDIVNSVPLDIELKYENGFGDYPVPKLFRNLIIDVKFMHGYFDDSNHFQNDYVNVVPSEQNILEYAGFKYLHWGKFNNVKKEDTALSLTDRVDTLVQRMNNMGLNALMVEAPWFEIFPTIDNISSTLDPATINSADIQNYILKGNWIQLDEIVAKATSGYIDNPILVIGCGHEGRPPIYQNANNQNDPNNGKRIAPGTTVRGNNAESYVAVPENVYLYWLKLYTLAVSYRYADDFKIMQAENELNAARYTESFDVWWRKGTAWTDDSENGFQTDVIKTLYNAIKDGVNKRNFDSNTTYSVDIMIGLHVFDAAKRLKEWKNYYDIVGLHIYPHLAHAFPVAGYLTGEFVWAARRILTQLGTPNKPVWLTETAFGANTAAPAPSDFIEKTQHYSFENQTTYLQQALHSCAQNGAQGFLYWNIESEETSAGETIQSEWSNNFAGFFDANGNRKEGYYAYRNTFGAITGEDPEAVLLKLSNKYQDELLKGSLGVEGVASGIISNRTIWLKHNKNYTLRTNSQHLTQPSTSDILQHSNWNGDVKEYNLNHSINFQNSDPTIQVARFNDTYEITAELNVLGKNMDGQGQLLRIRDPWWVDGTTKDIENFLTFEATSGTNTYSIFKDVNPNHLNLNEPYYSIRPPEVLYFADGERAIFKEWQTEQDVELKNDPRKPGDLFQKAVVAIGNNPKVKANYFNDIIVEESDIYFEDDQLILKANQLLTTQDSIYEFLEWRVYEADGTTENSSKLNIAFSNNYKTSVTFNSNASNTVIKPKYRAINNIENYVAELDSDEFLYVASSSNIKLAKGFSINVNGRLELAGEYGKEVQLTSVGDGFPTPSVVFNVSSTGELDFSYTHFKNFNSTNSGALIKFTGSGWDEKEEAFVLNNLVFENCENAIVSDVVGRINFKVKKSTFVNSNVKDFSNVSTDVLARFEFCVFYNSTFENEYFADYSTFWPTASGSYGQTSIVQNPNFVDVANGDFHLSWGSPCIDIAGSNEFDIDGSLVDQGAYFYAQLGDSLKVDEFTIGGEARITSNLKVKEGQTLKVNPGARVLLDKDVEITVDGTFIAEGTAADSIKFTSLITNPATSDYWKGITLSADANVASSIKYANFENVYMPLTIRNNSNVLHSSFSNVSHVGIYSNYSTGNIQYNRFNNCSYAGIYISYGNYVTGTQFIDHNTISNCTSGMRIYFSTPQITKNEVSGGHYGFYLKEASPNFGSFSVEGKNYIHNNVVGVQVYKSSPFFGEDYCGINGGNNKILNNSNYNIYARVSSYVLAEKNWWGSAPPATSKLGTSASTIDYTPYLTSAPSFSIIPSPEVKIFENAFISESKMLNENGISEEEAMANFDASWPISRKLKFARNLLSLNFPQSAYKICKEIISTEPEMMYAYAAFDIMWKTGNESESELQKFKTYIDSLAQLEEQNEIEEFAEFVDSEYQQKEGFSKKGALNNYKQYKNPRVAANALFSVIEYNLFVKKDYKLALEAYSVMQNEFAGSEELKEAEIMLGMLKIATDEQNSNIPESYELKTNYPNPFNATTTFQFGVPEVSNVKIYIYNILGQVINTIELKDVQPGYHKQIWDGKNRFGNTIASGMYIYKFTATSLTNKHRVFEKMSKMLLLK